MRDAVQVRGLIAEKVVLGTVLDPFLSLRALSNYSGLSVRTLRYALDDPKHPLPCYQVTRKLVVRRSEFDAWMTHHRGRTDVDGIVREVLDGLEGRTPERTQQLTLRTQHSINGVRYGPGPVTVPEEIAASLRSQEQAFHR